MNRFGLKTAMQPSVLFAAVRGSTGPRGSGQQIGAKINQRLGIVPGYVRTKPPFRPKLDAFAGVIDEIMAADKDQPKKQRHLESSVTGQKSISLGFNSLSKQGSSANPQRAAVRVFIQSRP